MFNRSDLKARWIAQRGAELSGADEIGVGADAMLILAAAFAARIGADEHNASIDWGGREHHPNDGAGMHAHPRAHGGARNGVLDQGGERGLRHSFAYRDWIAMPTISHVMSIPRLLSEFRPKER
jgi:hypothetical protein